MNLLQQKIRQQASRNPQKIAIQGVDTSLNYESLVNEIDRLIKLFDLSETSHQFFAFIMDNNPAWAIVDLALLFSRQCAIPLPKFFSIEQLKHALIDSGVENLIVDDSQLATDLINELNGQIKYGQIVTIANRNLTYYQVKISSEFLKPALNSTAAKITYTSGTTARPKGVVLSEQAIIAKVKALAKASEASESDVSLSVLPLSTLLENMAGLYVPLFCGASIILLPPAETGFSGSSQMDQNKLLAIIFCYRPTAFIIIPQLLQLLIYAVKDGYSLPDSVRFIAMGGAPVSLQLLETAKALKIPVYEGYGLSEAASVVAVNNPTNYRLGSVGRVLQGHEVQVSDKHEVLVKGHLFNGYLGEPAIDPMAYYATGDLGNLDADGFLYITGRKKNIIITSYGRNISPEWIEKELEACPAITQCLVYGHAKPYLIAIIVPFADKTTDHASVNDPINIIKEFINRLNESLPDYARILGNVFTNQEFTFTNNQLTGTGRPKRGNIYQFYQQQIQQCYELPGINIKSMERLCD